MDLSIPHHIRPSDIAMEQRYRMCRLDGNVNIRYKRNRVRDHTTRASRIQIRHSFNCCWIVGWMSKPRGPRYTVFPFAIMSSSVLGISMLPDSNEYIPMRCCTFASASTPLKVLMIAELVTSTTLFSLHYGHLTSVHPKWKVYLGITKKSLTGSRTTATSLGSNVGNVDQMSDIANTIPLGTQIDLKQVLDLGLPTCGR
jgi:hypothetical protein